MFIDILCVFYFPQICIRFQRQFIDKNFNVFIYSILKLFLSVRFISILFTHAHTHASMFCRSYAVGPVRFYIVHRFGGLFFVTVFYFYVVQPTIQCCVFDSVQYRILLSRDDSSVYFLCSQNTHFSHIWLKCKCISVHSVQAIYLYFSLSFMLATRSLTK